MHHGFIWIAALLASLFSINHVFISDIEDEHFHVLLSPYPLTMIVESKLAAEWCANSLPLIVLSLPAALSFHIPISALVCLTISLVLGTLLFTLIGGLVAGPLPKD